MAELSKKKQRNYVLDFWKIVACLVLACFHWQWVYWFPDEFWGGYYGYQEFLSMGFPFPKGTVTMGFFVATTGYWLVAAFKKFQQTGVLGKGHDSEIIFRYAAKNWVSYMPLIFFLSFPIYVLLNIKWGSDINTWIQQFVLNFWEFIGIRTGNLWVNSDTGMLVEYAYSLPEVNPNQLYTYGAVSWYPLMLVATAFIFFALLVINEKLFLWVIGPTLFSGLSIANQVNMISPDYQSWDALRQLFSPEFARLWGAAILGMYLWYIVDWLKKHEFTKKQENILGVINFILCATYLLQVWFGFYGNMFNMDMHIWAIVGFTLANKDSWTKTFNKALSKLWITRNLGDISTGMFALHYAVVTLFQQNFIDGNAMGLGTATLVYIGSCFALGFIWLPINKYIVVPIQGKLSHLLRLDTPLGQMFPAKEAAK